MVSFIASFHDTFNYQGFEHRLYRLVQRFAAIAIISTRYTNFLAYLSLSTAFRRNIIRLICPQKVVRWLPGGRDSMAPSQTTCSDAGNTSRTQI